jgi:hypothetical protein
VRGFAGSGRQSTDDLPRAACAVRHCHEHFRTLQARKAAMLAVSGSSGIF